MDEFNAYTITKKLGFRRFYFGKSPGWKWKGLWFGKKSSISGRHNPHITIVGSTGAGKSSACRAMITELCRRGENVAILDPDGDYLRIADSIGANVYYASYIGMNIFELDGMSANEKADELVGMFRRVFRLGEVQCYTLRRSILYTYKTFGEKANMGNLLYTISVIFRKRADSAELKVLNALEHRLSLLDSGRFSSRISTDEIIGKNSIMLLRGLHTNESQAVYMEGFLRKIYTHMHTSDMRGIRMRIVVDEAGKLSGSQVLGRLAAEGRKYGIGVITVTQRMKSLDRDVRSNASILVSMYQREPEELNYVSNLIAGGNELNRFAEVKKGLRNLGQGEAVVLDAREHEPVMVKFRMADEHEASLQHEIMLMVRSSVREDGLIKKISEKGFEGIQIREEIHRLLEKGRISKYELKCGSRYDGAWYLSMPKNSPEHDICVDIIKAHLESNGIRAEVHNKANGPDVIAYVDVVKIAMEYETGTKGAVELAEMLTRISGYASAVVVTN